jgi:hypothetical protein
LSVSQKTIMIMMIIIIIIIIIIITLKPNQFPVYDRSVPSASSHTVIQ